MIKKTIGGQRLGSGNKMTATMRTYERSTHDLGYLWRSGMAPGTLVPFMVEIALPGDTWDINLDAEVRTHPTLGPLFGSFKVQLDIFEAPMRLYNAQLHNNELGIGMNIQNVQFPQIELQSNNLTPGPNSYQVNPSAIYSYLGIRGLGTATSSTVTRYFNAMPYLAYWEIFKNYYANKQEANAYVIHTNVQTVLTNITTVVTSPGGTVPYNTLSGTPVSTGEQMVVSYTFSSAFTLTDTIIQQLRLYDVNGIIYQPSQLYSSYTILNNTTTTPSVRFVNVIINTTLEYWTYQVQSNITQALPTLYAFPLSYIDAMRTTILQAPYTSPLIISQASSDPYGTGLMTSGNFGSMTYSQEGLAVKTYQSDQNNNWMQTQWQTQISTVTAVSTAAGSFTIDSLNLAKKVYDMLNRIAISGGSYDDWIQTVYTADTIQRAESPIYHGGLSKEVLFQEVVSLSGSNNSSTTNVQQPLGTLAGKGIMGKKHKGGEITVHVKEPSYIMGIVSLTPRIDYSQGNKWIGQLFTMNDLHKPALDEIGFQNLITDQMAYWDSTCGASGVVTTFSAGLQPAWINYMTNVNQTYGNFAIPNNEMFMTLNRRYSQATGGRISDLTTYIDPSHYNFIFAQTSLDAMNFWTQIAVNLTVRRKMSAKIMPNL
nr:MAG: major capsid protein [Microviridae sp.]